MNANEIKIFENEEFGSVRTLVNKDGDILFCANDIAKALGYLDAAKAIRYHCKKDGGVICPLIDTVGREQKTKFITEGNVYRLIVKSKLPSAEKFEKWVFEEVLPTIRKTGGYITAEKLNDIFTNPDTLTEFLKQMLVVSEENQKLKKDITELEPKANYFDKLVDRSLLINFRTTSKELKIGQKQFINFLLANKYIYRDSKDNLLPMKPYVDKGYFEIKEFCRNGYTGTQTYITAKGRKYFLNLINNQTTII